jgi:hypothetical protein
MLDDRLFRTLVAVCVASLATAATGCDEPRAWADDESAESAEASPTDELEDSADTGSPSGPPEARGDTTTETDGETERSDRPLTERAMDPSVPLPDRARKALDDVEFDPIPDDLTEDAHYVVSNEEGHRVYRSHIRNHGGILLGVGTDQNYLLAGWSRSPILLMMDFDEQVRNVHHLYDVVFARIDEHEAFIDQWKDENVDQIRNWIDEDYADDEKRADELHDTLDLSHDSIYYRLRTTAERYRKKEIPTYLTDADQYAFVRGLFERDRVVPIRGDLTGDTAMLELADALETLGLELGLLYLSNAEQYFEYTPAYRRNVAVLPFSEESLVLRTRPMEALGLPEGDNYHYLIQEGRNFAGWMAYNKVENAKQLITWYRKKSRETDGLSFIRKEPPVSDPAPEVAKIGNDYDVELVEEP